MMITIWNRKELISTHSLTEQSNVRQRLTDAGIPFQIRAISQFRNRARTGSYGIQIDNANQYIIYVNRKDWYQAQHCLNRNN